MVNDMPVLFADVTDHIAQRLRRQIINDPHWQFLRERCAGVDCDAGFIVLRDLEENEEAPIFHRGDLPDRWLTPRRERLTSHQAEDWHHTLRVDEWHCVAPWATINLTAWEVLPPPGVMQRSDATYTIGFAFYERA